MLFVIGADRPAVPPGTSAEAALETQFAYHVGELVRDCEREQLPLLASLLLDATMVALVAAGVSKGAALRWLDKVAPDAYDVVRRVDPTAAAAPTADRSPSRR